MVTETTFSTPAAVLAATQLVESFVTDDGSIATRLHEADRDVTAALVVMLVQASKSLASFDETGELEPLDVTRGLSEVVTEAVRAAHRAAREREES